MITINPDGWIYRICGIDNGTNTPGVVINDHNLKTGVSTIVFAQSMVASKAAYDFHPGVTAHRGKLAARLLEIRPWWAEILEEYDPDVIGCESPFAHLGIDTFVSLLDSMDVFETETYRHRDTLQFIGIPPGRAKKAACPEGQYSNDKEMIRQFILKDERIVAGPGIVLDQLDEHCIDATAVTRCLALHAARAFA